MTLDKAAALEQIDHALKFWTQARNQSEYDDLSDLGESGMAEVATVLADALCRFAPPGSVYLERAKSASEQYAKSLHLEMAAVHGILKALRTAYAAGYLLSVQELAHADVFSDFLEMADYLLGEGYKDAGAVIGGSVLEENIRKLCAKNGVPTAGTKGQPKKASMMNDDLAKAGIYGKLEQKSVTAWLDLRNKAAHGDFAAYNHQQVELFLQGIRDFLTRHPA